jgi:adenylylsulfate kinase-like enzyme
MIIVLFGQPCSGKTTLAKGILEYLDPYYTEHIDGDRLRELFANKDFSREGRIKNLNRASDIAHYLNSKGNDVVLSLVYPYQEARDYLNSLNDDVKWIYLTYEGERGREKNHVSDFDVPADGVLHLNTSSLNLEECVSEIKNYIHDGKIPSQFSGEDIL